MHYCMWVCIFGNAFSWVKYICLFLGTGLERERDKFRRKKVFILIYIHINHVIWYLGIFLASLICGLCESELLLDEYHHTKLVILHFVYLPYVVLHRYLYLQQLIELEILAMRRTNCVLSALGQVQVWLKYNQFSGSRDQLSSWKAMHLYSCVD